MVLDTCYGDLFSVSWMENAETVDLTAETLQVGRLRRDAGTVGESRWIRVGIIRYILQPRLLPRLVLFLSDPVLHCSSADLS